MANVYDHTWRPTTTGDCGLCGSSQVEIQPVSYNSKWLLVPPPHNACRLCFHTVRASHFERAAVEYRDIMFHANFVGNEILKAMK